MTVNTPDIRNCKKFICTISLPLLYSIVRSVKVKSIMYFMLIIIHISLGAQFIQNTKLYTLPLYMYITVNNCVAMHTTVQHIHECSSEVQITHRSPSLHHTNNFEHGCNPHDLRVSPGGVSTQGSMVMFLITHATRVFPPLSVYSQAA